MRAGQTAEPADLWSGRPGVPVPRLRRVRRAVRSALRSPSSVIRHQEWYLQESGLRPERTDDLGMLFRLAPRFIARECTALVDPSGVPAAQADHMRDDDVVVGIALGGAARAYPWWIMDNHHLANDVVGGRPVALAFCEMCSSAIALDPIVDGRRMIFEPNHVYNGMPAMQDRATRSVWAPYLARAIRGRLEGRVLGPLPAVHIEWAVWRAQHPETDVLPADLGSRTGHGSRHSIESPEVGYPMRGTTRGWDARLPHNALILGVSVGGRACAYPWQPCGTVAAS